MKAFRRVAKVGSASVVLGLLGLLVGCSLETTGSGDFSLSADDDSDDEAPVGDDHEDPSDGDDERDDDPVDASEPGDGSSEGRDAGQSDGAGKCQPGSYLGSFSCKQPAVMGPPWASGLGGNEINGTFTFRLEPAGMPDTFVLKGGTIHSADNPFFQLDATIAATWECGQPLRGKLTEATYTAFFSAGPKAFESAFDASYDEATGKFVDGAWIVKDGSVTHCNGTWTATRNAD